MMRGTAIYISSLLLPLLVVLAGCYDMTVRIVKMPENTPPSESIYISGNFNNWDPGDPDYVLTKGSDSVLEVRLPRGVGEVNYKFTRGDWSTVEKDPCGFEISNRAAIYGRSPVCNDTIRSWNDLPKPGCPSLTIVIDSVPENTPENSVFYLASNINDWDPGSRYWMFIKGPDGKYYIDVPLPNSRESEYKVTRGDWGKVEVDAEGNDIDNRSFIGMAGEKIRIRIAGWKDR
jgi:hypothetical protein